MFVRADTLCLVAKRIWVICTRYLKTVFWFAGPNLDGGTLSAAEETMHFMRCAEGTRTAKYTKWHIVSMHKPIQCCLSVTNL